MKKRRLGQTGGFIFRTSFALCLVIMLTLVTGAAAEYVSAAKSKRLAVITDMGGTVTVQAAGASQAYDAYTDMGLNQGDFLQTGEDSYVVLKIKDTGDEITFGAYSEIYISSLAENSSGKSSKIKMWAGSAWASIKRLVSDDDELELETPTAVMGVRGTQFFTSVNPLTGQTSLMVASGKVRASTVTASENEGTRRSLQDAKYVMVYPAQQLNLDSRTQAPDLRTMVSNVQVGNMVQNTDTKLLEALIKNKAEIDRENAEYLAKLQEQLSQGAPSLDEQSVLHLPDLEELDKVKRNLDNLVASFAKTALDSNKFTSDQMSRIVNDTNRKIGEDMPKLDLNRVEPIDPAAGLDPEKEKEFQLERERLEAVMKRQAEEEAARKAAEEQRLKDLLSQIREQLAKLEEERQNAEEAAQEAALEELKKDTDAGTGTGTGTDSDTSTGAGPGPGPTPPPDDTNQLPTVTWSNQMATKVTTGQSVRLLVKASDPDGTVQKVEFSSSKDSGTFQAIGNGTLMGDSYYLDWTPQEAGSYQLKAAAFDNKNASGYGEIHVTVEPEIQFTSLPGTGGTDLVVRIPNFDAKAIQLHFTTGNGNWLQYGTPISKVFTGSGAYTSSLNMYADNPDTPQNFEYVFAALFSAMPSSITETEVFRVTVTDIRNAANAAVSGAEVKLAYIKMVLRDGSTVELTPDQLTTTLTNP